MNAIFRAAAVINNLNRAPLHRRYNIHDNPFELSDARFKKVFRLDKEMAREWVGILEPHMTAPTRDSSIDIESKVRIFVVCFHFFIHSQDVKFVISIFKFFLKID